LGRREVEPGLFVVSGGYLGLVDDIVVDNYLVPSQIIGVCDGMGDLKESPSPTDVERLTILKKGIN